MPLGKGRRTVEGPTHTLGLAGRLDPPGQDDGTGARQLIGVHDVISLVGH